MERTWEEAVVAESKYYRNISLEAPRRTMKPIRHRISTVPTDIRNGHLSNEGSERYCYTYSVGAIFSVTVRLEPQHLSAVKQR
jgi:hypothetical protein